MCKTAQRSGKMTTCDAETILLLYLLTDFYEKPKVKLPSFREVSIPNLLQLSARNNFGYHISKAVLNAYGEQLSQTMYSKLETLIEHSESLFKDLRKTTATLKSHLDEYIIHKTYRGYPRIPSDIDTLVPNLSNAVGKLKSAGMGIRGYDKHQVMLVDDDGIQVHLHDRITWADSFFFDKKLALQNPRVVSMWNTDVRIPNVNADFLIHLAHINFEPLHFTLSDFLYLCKLAPLVNWTTLLHQARKHNWTQSFIHTLSLIDEYHHSLYPSPCPFNSLNLKHQPRNHDLLVFPKDLPRPQIVAAFLEKRPLSYLQSKLLKSVHILATGDTYKTYYRPPELALFSKLMQSDAK